MLEHIPFTPGYVPSLHLGRPFGVPWTEGSAMIPPVVPRESVSCTVNGTIHRCVPSEPYRTTNCIYCKQHNVKTKAGWPVTTRARCSVCKVPLCNKRGCFNLFHKEVFSVGKEPDGTE